MMYYVYVHENKINGKKYVGITNNIKNRWSCNGVHYRPDDKNSKRRPFWNAICKYGWDSFTHSIIETVDTFEEACEEEKRYIKALNTTDMSVGYNVAIGGNGGLIYKEHPRGMLGKHHSEEKKRKQSKIMSELNKSGKMIWKNGHPRGMSGKHHVYPVYYTLNGETHEFKCAQELKKSLGIDSTLYYKLVDTGIPYDPKGNFKIKNAGLRGLLIFRGQAVMDYAV